MERRFRGNGLEDSSLLARQLLCRNVERFFYTCIVERPLETIQFLFTGAQFLTDGGMFGFSEPELRARRLVMQTIIEKALGAKPGSLQFMNPIRAVD